MDYPAWRGGLEKKVNGLSPLPGDFSCGTIAWRSSCTGLLESSREQHDSGGACHQSSSSYLHRIDRLGRRLYGRHLRVAIFSVLIADLQPQQIGHVISAGLLGRQPGGGA